MTTLVAHTLFPYWLYIGPVNKYITYIEQMWEQYIVLLNGLLSAGPYFTFWILSFMFSAIADYVVTHKYVSTGVARKVANSIGLLVPAVALLALGLISSSIPDVTTTLVLLFIAVGINGSCYCGYNVNHMDLSPVHSGTLMGISNGTSNVFSIIAPLIIQYLVTDATDPSEWAIVFYISAGVYVLGNTFYVIFASGEIQPWNDANYKSSSNKNPQKVSNSSTVAAEI